MTDSLHGGSTLDFSSLDSFIIPANTTLNGSTVLSSDLTSTLTTTAGIRVNAATTTNADSPSLTFKGYRSSTAKTGQIFIDYEDDNLISAFSIVGPGSNRVSLEDNGNVQLYGSSESTSVIDIKGKLTNATQGYVVVNTLRPTLLELEHYTTAQRDALGSVRAGTMVWNTTLGKANIYNGTAWEVVTSV